VKVGHRQTPINRKALLVRAFLFMVSGVDRKRVAVPPMKRMDFVLLV